MRQTPPSERDGAWILAATIVGSSMAFIDGTVVNVALPVIQRELNTNVSGVQWVVEVYTLFLASLLLVGGVSGDRFGRRRMYTLGIVLFTLASLGAGLAPSIGLLIAARAAQGIGGALLIPGSLAIIRATFDDQHRGKAIGAWAGFTAMTAALGPILGGWVVDNASWRWVFFINIPLAVLVIALLYWRVPESRNADAPRRLDIWGALLITLGLGSVIFGLVESTQLGFDHPLIVAALIVGVILIAVFIRFEARVENPMLPLDIFSSPTFSGSNLLTLLLYTALGSFFFYLPFNLIQVQGYSPTAAGAAVSPVPVLMFLLSRWSGGLVSRSGARLPLIAGPIVAAVGLGLLALPGVDGTYWSGFFPGIVVLGLGLAVTVAPLTTTVLEAVESAMSGLASGVNNAVARTADMFAVAAMGVVLVAVFSAGLESGLEQLDLSETQRQAIHEQRSRLAALEGPDTLSESERAELERLVAGAYIEGFRVVMLSAAGLALAASLTAFLMVGREKSDSGEGQGET